jgi:hypothetical protein
MKGEKLNFFEKIYLWFKFEGRYYHKDFIRGVKNIWRWFPIIWRDRDWDDHYIWVLMIQKLKFQSKYIGERDIHVSAKRDAEIMMTCVRLMEKVKEEFYHMEYMDYHESDYNWIECDKPGYKQLDIVQKSEKFDEYFAKYPLVYKKIKKQNPEDSKDTIAIKMSWENHNRARKILFKLMESNIERWWD